MSRRGRLALVVGLIALASAPCAALDVKPAPDTSLAAALEETGTMALASDGVTIKNERVDFGHMEISFAEGTLVPVLGKSGATLGVYFEGRGGYLYTTTDVADRAALSVNAARVAKSIRTMQGRVTDDFKSALILFSEPQFTDLYADASLPHASASAMSGSFQTMLAGALSTYGDFGFFTATARLNGHGRFVYAELSGGLERVGYAFDDVHNGRERFFNFRKLADYNVRFSETLSYQSIPGWTAERRKTIAMTRAEVAVDTPDNRSGTIDSDLTFHVHDAGTRVLPLLLLNNRDPDSADWSSPKNKLTVKRVVDANGRELPFSHRYGILLVEIPPTAAADADVKIRVETSGEVFVDMKGHHGDNYFSLNYEDWYPRPVSWSARSFTFAVKVRCKKPWSPVTSGKQTSSREDGDFVTAEARSDVRVDTIAVFGGKYVTRGETVDGVLINIHAYAMARKNVLDNMPKLAGSIAKFYASLLGPMPVDELDIVEVPEYGFGISPPGLILMTTEAYKPHEEEANYFVEGVNARLAHEIAHQWFAHKAALAGPDDNWLSESFAEYFAGLAMGAMNGDDKNVFGFNKMIANWKGQDKYCTDGAPIAAADYLGGEDGDKDRTCLLYARGPLVLHMLRTSIGNDRFAAAAKKYLDTANNGPATTDDYAKALSDIMQMDMRWYVDQWVRRSGNAQVGIEQHLDADGPGGYKLWGVIRQAPGDGFKKLLVPFVWDNGGKTEARVVFADEPEKKFEFKLASKPGTVKPDPYQNNLAVYK
ncbi:MAG TPA: M1 family aminopeptidase [Candidatus Polarisedimenticolaceae bacterium]|nr:M1 family aminopeptidase [Candidatus Polarisedimenticolaceae bacterium]